MAHKVKITEPDYAGKGGALFEFIRCHLTGSNEVYRDVEYRLLSWGRLKDTIAEEPKGPGYSQVIWSGTLFQMIDLAPGDADLPQKIAISFRAPMLPRAKSRSFQTLDFYVDEIAREFAALLSLITRRRVFPSGLIRFEGQPCDWQEWSHSRDYPQEAQQDLELSKSDIETGLRQLFGLGEDRARPFLLACSLYHSAVRLMFTEPEFAYLFLVISLEAISSTLYRNWRPPDAGGSPTPLEEVLDSQFPGWTSIAGKSKSRREQLKTILSQNTYFTFQKLRKFVNTYISDEFFRSVKDSARPIKATKSWQEGIESGSDIMLDDWEIIPRKRLNSVLRAIYTARSQMVHEGIRMSRSIVVGLGSSIPREITDRIMLQNFEAQLAKEVPQAPLVQLDVPPLLTFERLVSDCLCGYLRSVPIPININSASESELMSLPGVGAARAQAICRNRPFGSAKELEEKKILPRQSIHKLISCITIK